MSYILRQLRWLLIPYMVLLAACVLIRLLYTRSEIYFAVNGFNTPLADRVAPLVTDLGNGWTAVALAIIMTLFSYRRALLVAVVYAVTSLSAQLLKYIFDEPRPKLYFKTELSRIHFDKAVDILSYHSFPSGHTTTAFSLAVLFTYWSRNKAWGILFLLFACFVGYSRMYLSEHFFEDVIGGSVLGVVLTLICILVLENKPFMQRRSWNRGLLTR